MPMKSAAFPQFIQSFVADGNFRKQVLADPNGMLKSAGVDVGNAKISLSLAEAPNQAADALLIYVENAGADWSGSATLVLKK